MVSGTRGHDRNTDENPPPPPDANLAQILCLLLEDRNNSRAEREASIAALQQIAQAAVNNNNNNNNDEEPRSKLRDFQNTNPLVFSKSIKTLDADDWLRTIEKNLLVAHVDNGENNLLVAHVDAPLKTTCWLPLQPISLPYQLVHGGKLPRPWFLLDKRSPGRNSRRGFAGHSFLMGWSKL